jgi:hypothetical protein
LWMIKLGTKYGRDEIDTLALNERSYISTRPRCLRRFQACHLPRNISNAAQTRTFYHLQYLQIGCRLDILTKRVFIEAYLIMLLCGRPGASGDLQRAWGAVQGSFSGNAHERQQLQCVLDPVQTVCGNSRRISLIFCGCPNCWPLLGRGT